MIVADTSVWIDYVNGVRTAAQTNILDKELQESRVVTGDGITQGFCKDFGPTNSSKLPEAYELT